MKIKLSSGTEVEISLQELEELRAILSPKYQTVPVPIPLWNPSPIPNQPWIVGTGGMTGIPGNFANTRAFA